MSIATPAREHSVRLRASGDEALMREDPVLIELAACRRSLAILKGVIDRDLVVELLEEQFEATDDYLRERAARSTGGRRSSFVELEVTGISADEFLDWFMTTAFPNPAIMNAGHPEHFSEVLPEIIETFSDETGVHRVVRIFVESLPLEEAHVAPDLDFQHKRAGKTVLADGTELCRSLSEFRNTDTGMIIRMNIGWVDGLPEELALAEERHLVTEFTTWLGMAAEALGTQA
jgi:hypothetical protein